MKRRGDPYISKQKKGWGKHSSLVWASEGGTVLIHAVTMNAIPLFSFVYNALSVQEVQFSCANILIISINIYWAHTGCLALC